MAHTPGQWFYDPKTESVGFSGGWICLVGDGYREGEGLGDQEDDARLIMSAPELLNACKAALSTLRSYQYGNASPVLADEVGHQVEELILYVEGG